MPSTGSDNRRIQKRCSKSVELLIRLAIFLVFAIFPGTPASAQVVDLLVNNKPLPGVPLLSRNVLPLEPIAKALGNTVLIDPVTRIITITRISDGSVMTYNLSTGVIDLNKIPLTTMPIVIPILENGFTYLRDDVLAYLLSVSVNRGSDNVNVVSEDAARGEVVQPTADWRDISLHYLRYDFGNNALYPQPPPAVTSDAQQNNTATTSSGTTTSGNVDLSPIVLVPASTGNAAATTTNTTSGTTTTTSPAAIVTVSNTPVDTSAASVPAAAPALSGSVSTAASANNNQNSANADGGSTNPKGLISRAYQAYTGGHVGPIVLDSGLRLVGGNTSEGVKGRFLTYHTGFIKADDKLHRWQADAGDNPIGLAVNQLTSGYLLRGLDFRKQLGRKFAFNALGGVGLTQNVEVGGGITRPSFTRPLVQGEFAYYPTEHLTTSVSSLGFADASPVPIQGANIKQSGVYVGSSTLWNRERNQFTGSLFTGLSERNPNNKGPGYAVDLRYTRVLRRYLTVHGLFDKYSKNFAPPSIGSPYQNRQDVGGSVNLSLRKFGGSIAYQNTVQEITPPQVTTSSFSYSTYAHPVEAGPYVSWSTNYTTVKQAALPATATNVGADASTAKQQVSVLSVNQNVLGFQLSGNYVILKTQNPGSEETISRSVTASLLRYINRIGSFSAQTLITSDKLYQLTTQFTTIPIFNRFVLLFGPGFVHNPTQKVFTFSAAVTTDLPYLARNSVGADKVLGQIRGATRSTRTINFKRKDGVRTVEDIPLYGRIVGKIYYSATFPPPPNATGVGGLPIIIDGQQNVVVETKPDGSYVFDAIPPGLHSVELDLTRVPASYALTSPEKFLVRVQAGVANRVNFSMARTGMITGKVQAEGKVDDEDAVYGMRLYLKENQRFDAATEPDGTFRITDMAPGSYNLVVDENSVMDGYTVEPSSIPVVVKEAATSGNIIFHLKAVPRKTEIRKF